MARGHPRCASFISRSTDEQQKRNPEGCGPCPHVTREPSHAAPHAHEMLSKTIRNQRHENLRRTLRTRIGNATVRFGVAKIRLSILR